MSKPLGKVRGVILTVLTILAVACFGTGWYLDTLYYQSRPRQPQPAEGRIYRENVYHGAVVYLTRREQLVHHYAPPLGILIGVGAWLIYHRGDLR